MRIMVDSHTHTIASQHAYSTVMENAQAAARRKLELLAITDHAPALEDSSGRLHFLGYHVLPDTLSGVRMLYGAELNIMDYKGTVDLDDELASQLDICIASFHPICTAPGTKAENTQTYLHAMEHPFVQVIGHPNDGKVPVDFDELARAAAENDVLLEVNNATAKPSSYRMATRENLVSMLRACERFGAMVSLGTDAHFAEAVGNFSLALDILEEVSFPEELVACISAERFLSCLGRRAGRGAGVPA